MNSENAIFGSYSNSSNRDENTDYEPLLFAPTSVDSKEKNPTKISVKETIKEIISSESQAKKENFTKEEIASIRKNLKLTQSEFAQAFGISLASLRNWEQGHRNPTGAAVTLLRVAQNNPKALLEAIR